ncbi:MAG: hypothetical protein ACFFD2_28670, partial [Promethearchaeota archaeon]
MHISSRPIILNIKREKKSYNSLEYGDIIPKRENELLVKEIKMPIIIVSNRDLAGRTIKSQLLKMGNFIETERKFEGNI